MKLSLPLILLIGFSNWATKSKGQTIDLTGDTILCQNGHSSLLADTTASGLEYNWIDYLNDDQHSDTINIGFDFYYYGEQYNQCVISSNGYITFDLSAARTYSYYRISTPFPDSLYFASDTIVINQGQDTIVGHPANRIMFPWNDFNPGFDENGIISTIVCGEEPFRKFVCTFDKVPQFGSSQDNSSSFQVVLHETTGLIEMNLMYLDITVGINSETGIQGLVNQFGNTAHIIGQRNYPNEWADSIITFDSHRFTPHSDGGYVIESTNFKWVNYTDRILWEYFTDNNTSQIIYPDSSGWHYVKLEYACGIQEMINGNLVGGVISDSLYIKVNNCNSINEFAKKTVVAHPNPNNGSFTLELAGYNGDFDVQLINSLGQTVDIRTISVNNFHTERYEVDIAVNGLYFLRVTGENTNEVLRVVIGD